MKKFYSIISLVVLCLVVPVVGLGQVSITNLPTTLSQNFDGFSSTATQTWTDNSNPLTGWYSTVSSLTIGNGSGSINGVYNFGSANATDRALGALSTTTTHQFAIRIKNNSASTISSFDISFNGEQWRQNAASHTLVFEYYISSSAITSITPGIFTPAASLDFVSPNIGPPGSLDGNLAANRTPKSATIIVSVPSGSEIMFRWSKSGTNSHGLGIDDLSITANGAACTIPTTQASIVGFSSILTTSANVSWTSGNGANRVVFMKQAATGTAPPVDNTTYTANTIFPTGTQIGATGWYCIYNGTGTTVSVSGLTASTDYVVMVTEYNCAAGSERYLTSAATNNPNTFTTASPAVIISNTGTPVAGSISTGTSNTVLSAFNLNANTSNDFTAVTITKTGTTSSADLSTIRIFYDVNANSIIDAGDVSVSGAGIALANSMGFTITGQTGFIGTRRYLVVADVAVTATVGSTVTTSVAAITDVSTSIANKSGTAPGNTQTIVNITATSDYFRSNVTTGSWATAASWESSHNNSVWFTATAPPTSAANTISILATHTINVNTSITLDQTSIFGTMELQTGGVLNIIDGVGDDIIINSNGVLRVTNTNDYASGVIPGTSQIDVLTGGKITIGDGTGATGANYHGFATNINNIWNSGAIYEYNSLTTFGTNNLTYFPNAATGVVPIFRVTKVSGNPGTSAATIINGLLEVNSSFIFVGSGDKILRDGIIGTATLTLDATLGTTTISGPGAILGGSLTLILNKNLNLTDGVTVPIGANVLVNGTTNITKNAGSFFVNGTIDITDRTISNTSGNVTVNGTLKTSHLSGLYNSGNIASGTIVLNTGSTIEYNATVPQSITSTGVLGQSYYNITFSGGGTKTPNNAINVNTLGTVKITGVTTIVDARFNNIGLTGANTTNFIMDTGRLRLGTAGTQPNMNGTYTLTGGVIEFTGTNATTIRNKSYQNLEVTGTNIANSNGNITLNDNGTFIVKSGGVFTINDNTITGPAGTQTVTVETGGLFKTGNNEGFSGFIASFSGNSSLHQNIENIILQTGSTVEYSRSNPPLTSGTQNISSTVPYYHLTFSGTDVKKAPTGTITVLGNLTKSGTSTFDPNGGTVLLNGSTQSFAGLSYNSLWLDNTGTKTLVGDGSVLDSIRIGNLASDPATIFEVGDNYFTLKSTALKTARVSTVAPAANITYGSTGRFVVERYYQPRRGWRLITAPITADAGRTVFNSWQKGGLPASLEGTYVSGPMAPAGGLDVSPLQNYSLKLFTGNVLVGVNDTKTMVLSNNFGIAGKPDNYGMFMFVRGDRSTSSLLNPPFANITTLRDTGKIQIGTQTFNLPSPGVGLPSLIGNPYASPVDFGAVLGASTNLSKNKFYAWDPFLSSAQGAYVTFVLSSGVYVATPPSPGGFTSTLQSSQAVYVEHSSAAAATLPFVETNKKTIAAPPTVLFRPLLQPASFRTNLFLKETNKVTILADGNFVEFADGNANRTDSEDALKFTNSLENFGLKREGSVYAVERRTPIVEDDTLFFDMFRFQQREYQLQFEPNNLDPTLNGILEDNFTGDKTPVNLTHNSSFDFAVTSDPASAAADRFRIVFKVTSSGPLPVTITGIKAYEVARDIAVEWMVQHEINIRHYEIEKSTDGIHFSKVNTTTATGAISGTTTYSWLDAASVTGDNYYRIVIIGTNGKADYTRIVKVSKGKVGTGFAIYPNPVVGGEIGLQFNNMPAGKYGIRLINNLGQLLLGKTIEFTGGSATQTVSPNQTLAKGIYQLEITHPDKTKTTLTVMDN